MCNTIIIIMYLVARPRAFIIVAGAVAIFAVRPSATTYTAAARRHNNDDDDDDNNNIIIIKVSACGQLYVDRPRKGWPPHAAVGTWVQVPDNNKPAAVE